MNLAYLDTSFLVAIAFAEAGARRVAVRLGRFDRVFSSNLLEAELRSALIREGVSGDAARPLLAGITWIYPNRPLTREYDWIAAAGPPGRCQVRVIAVSAAGAVGRISDALTVVVE